MAAPPPYDRARSPSEQSSTRWNSTLHPDAQSVQDLTRCVCFPCEALGYVLQQAGECIPATAVGVAHVLTLPFQSSAAPPPVLAPTHSTHSTVRPVLSFGTSQPPPLQVRM